METQLSSGLFQLHPAVATPLSRVPCGQAVETGDTALHQALSGEDLISRDQA